MVKSSERQMSVSAAAVLLGIHRHTVREWMRRGKLRDLSPASVGQAAWAEGYLAGVEGARRMIAVLLRDATSVRESVPQEDWLAWPDTKRWTEGGGWPP